MYGAQSKRVETARYIWDSCEPAFRSSTRNTRRAQWTVSMWTAVGVFLSLCAYPVPSALAQGVSAPVIAPPFEPVTNVHQTMAWIVYPMADLIWDSAGTIITAQGSKELAPTTDEGWAEVVRAAAILTESGNLLMMPGRAAGDDWIRYSQGLVKTGKLALQAAQAQDSDALFDAGGEIYQVCKSCHEQYWVEID